MIIHADTRPTSRAGGARGTASLRRPASRAGSSDEGIVWMGSAGMHAVRFAFVRLLADTVTLRDLYAKHGEQARGVLAKVFRLICQRHRVEHERLAAILATHIRVLGEEALVMTGDIAVHTSIPRPPRGREPLVVQVDRMIDAHERIAEQAIALMACCAGTRTRGLACDDTALIASELVLTGELHVWLLAQHLKRVAGTSADDGQTAVPPGGFLLPLS